MSENVCSRITSAIMRSPWAITTEGLDLILSIVKKWSWNALVIESLNNSLSTQYVVPDFNMFGY